jgi:hypothetical protein
LGQRDAIGAGPKEFDMSADFAKDRFHHHVTHGSLRNRTLGENGGTSGEREALKDANEVGPVDGK